jgi:hypothetical protein
MNGLEIITANVVTVALSTGIMLWKAGTKFGRLDEMVLDHQRQLDRLADESATKAEQKMMQEAYQDAVKGLVSTVDQRIGSLEGMVGRRLSGCETQITELRTHLMRLNGG